MIELQSVTVGYGRAPVLREVSLTFPQGGLTVLLGPNGCGKSTLLKTAAGLLRPASGLVLVEGKPLKSYTGRQLAQRIAYLPQVRAIPAIAVERMVLHGRFPYLGIPRRYRPEDYAAVQKALRVTGIEELSGRDMTTLSGGERQKVYIAMALAQETPIVLLDEPTTYLDIDRQLEVMRLSLLLKEQGKTVVMVLHDLNLAFRFADRLLLMEHGRLCAEGSPQEFCESGALEPVFHVRAFPVALPDGTRQVVFY